MIPPGRRSPRTALLALLLSAPVAGLGAWVALHLAPGTFGVAIYALSKAWLLLFPLVWLRLVERAPWSLSPARHGGWGMALLTGVAFAVVILAAYYGIAHRWIDPAALRDLAHANGFGTASRYLAFAAYVCLVNALLEEYVWRWFVQRQCMVLLPPLPAIVLAAGLFTAHHAVALTAYLTLGLTLAACAGVFVGGLTWGWLVHRYRSIWPAYLSHIVADLAVFYIGWQLILGA